MTRFRFLRLVCFLRETYGPTTNLHTLLGVGIQYQEVTEFLRFRRTTERKQRNVLRNEQHALRTMRTMQESNNQPKVNDDEHSSSIEPLDATEV